MGDDFVVAVIDCTGHGVPGAFMTILAVTGLRRIIHEEKEYNPARILNKLNAYVKHSLGDTRQSDDGMDAGICRFRSYDRILEYAGAKIPLYEIRDNTVFILKADKQSLGYVNSGMDVDFTLHEIKVIGQVFYMVTDGYIDQLGGESERPKRFGSKRFKDQLEACHGKPFVDQKDMFEAALKEHQGPHDNTDDVTLVGFSISE